MGTMKCRQRFGPPVQSLAAKKSILFTCCLVVLIALLCVTVTFTGTSDHRRLPSGTYTPPPPSTCKLCHIEKPDKEMGNIDSTCFDCAKRMMVCDKCNQRYSDENPVSEAWHKELKRFVQRCTRYSCRIG